MNNNKHRQTKKSVQVFLSDRETEEVDKARGLIPRATYMRAAALEKARNGKKVATQ